MKRIVLLAAVLSLCLAPVTEARPFKKKVVRTKVQKVVKCINGKCR
jgi:hypothetical protein